MLNESVSSRQLWLLATAKLKIRRAQAVSGSRSFDAYCVDFALTALFCVHERHKSVGSLRISFHVLHNQEIKQKKNILQLSVNIHTQDPDLLRWLEHTS